MQSDEQIQNRLYQTLLVYCDVIFVYYKEIKVVVLKLWTIKVLQEKLLDVSSTTIMKQLQNL